MRLTPLQIERAVGQFQFQQVPDDSRLMPELSRTFGDHTFFIGSAGLHIIDPVEVDEIGRPVGRIVKLASWTDPQHTTLAAHEPEFTDAVIDLGSSGHNGA
jgi:hypothetical protein